MAFKKYVKTPHPIKVTHMGEEVPSKYDISMHVVKFTSVFGALKYYSTKAKRAANPYKEQLHQDIIASLEGRNSGWYDGLTYEQGAVDLYIEANPGYRILSAAEAAEWESKLK